MMELQQTTKDGGVTYGDAAMGVIAGHKLMTAEINIEQAFRAHYQALYRYAFTMLKDEHGADEAVQNVFYKLWKNRDKLSVNQSVISYLYRSVYNECLNTLKHEKVKQAYQAHAARTMEQIQSASEKLKLAELEKKLNEALCDLPEQCRTIFQMSRFEELKYLEIADRLGISVKTVENQMGKALRILRSKLSEFLPILLFIIFNR